MSFKKSFKRIVELVQEMDLFAPHIPIRYKRENDYKTCTGAIVSLALLVFFGVVFVNSFIDMVHRTSITTTVLLKEENDPSKFTTETPSFMFAIGLNGIDMNSGPRYFNLQVIATTIVNNTKTKKALQLVPCVSDFWRQLGDNYVTLFDRLSLSQWLCPAPGQDLELQGKFSSETFKYLKISVLTCSGVFNGQGCRTAQEVQDYLTTHESFGFSYYFVNTLINVDQQEPITMFLDDTNNFEFTTSLGISCNFYLQSYELTTDMSLMPVNDPKVDNGVMATEGTRIWSFLPNQGQYLRFYVRKSPQKRIFERHYYKLDELLSYIGGLFGLIASVIQLPLTYYNICCFELHLATELFTYHKPDKKRRALTNKIQPMLAEENINRNRLQEQEQQNTIDVIQPQQMSQHSSSKEEPHSIHGFNFLVYIVYVPFFLLKKAGWKSLENERFTPYYEAIEQVRKQIDIGKMIERFLYLDRVSKSLLDENQRKLLHVFPKENIYQLEEQRRGFKLRERIRSTVVTKTSLRRLDSLIERKMVDLDEQQYEAREVREAYNQIKDNKDAVNQRILESLDREVINKLTEIDKEAEAKKEIEDCNDEVLQNFPSLDRRLDDEGKLVKQDKLNLHSHHSSDLLFRPRDSSPVDKKRKKLPKAREQPPAQNESSMELNTCPNAAKEELPHRSLNLTKHVSHEIVKKTAPQ